MSEITSKPMFSFNEVQEELANLREQIAQEIEEINCDRDYCQDNLLEGGTHRFRCSHSRILDKIRGK